MMQSKNIVLCGFMGCGKSTLGPLLAKRLSMSFVDMDDYIEQRENMSVPEIFRLFSEEGFRDREHEAVLELASKRELVIAAGGGALLYERNVFPLKNTGVILFLDTDFDECYRRIVHSSRPLVKTNTSGQLRQLFEVRRKIYGAAADFTLKTGAVSPPELAQTAADLLETQ